MRASPPVRLCRPFMTCCLALGLAHRVTHIVLLVAAVITWMPMLSPVPEVFPRLSAGPDALRLRAEHSRCPWWGRS